MLVVPSESTRDMGHGTWAAELLQGIPKCHLQFTLVPSVLGCSGCLAEGQWDIIPSPEAAAEALGPSAIPDGT